MNKAENTFYGVYLYIHVIFVYIAERSVGYHDLAFTSTAEASALSEVKSLRPSSKLLLRLHGSFMIVAWIGAASIGIVIARYYKQTWVGGSCCSKDLWFGVRPKLCL